MKYSCLLLWLRLPLSRCLSFKPYCYSCRRIAGSHAEEAQGEILKDLHLISRFNQMWMLRSQTRSVTRQCCGIVVWPHVSFSDCSDPESLSGFNLPSDLPIPEKVPLCCPASSCGDVTCRCSAQD